MNSHKHLLKLKKQYHSDGFVSGVDVISQQQASSHRQALERAEKEIGKVHYKTKIHTVLKSPFELATLPNTLDIVEQFIGPDILLYNVTYIVKEPQTSSHVSWHQDLTYWGLSHDDQVSMWLALTPATKQSGCMRMIPKSHRHRALKHERIDDDNNVLFQGQTVDGVSEKDAEFCPLKPGQASFHHGWTLHASTPNTSKDRRIGLNIQYLAPHVYQTKQSVDTAMLVRGNDNYHHFGADLPACKAIDFDAINKQAELESHYKSIAASN